VLANGIWGPARTQQQVGLIRLSIQPASCLCCGSVNGHGRSRDAMASASFTALVLSIASETAWAAERCAAAYFIMCSVSQFITIFSPKLLPISPGVGSRAPKS
jgi:hypothetical protein